MPSNYSSAHAPLSFNTRRNCDRCGRLISGWKFIETTSHSQLLVLVWAIVAFIIPVVLATIDLRDVARRWRDAGFSAPDPHPHLARRFGRFISPHGHAWQHGLFPRSCRSYY